ncbi:MAG: HlyD family efflux transporter periplasmic adaptor subunit [Bacteroidota bacterium]
MPKEIFPSEILRFTLEGAVAKLSSRSQVIYIIITGKVILALVAMPLLNVDVSVQSPGVIRPGMEMTVINSPASGDVSNLFVRENEMVSVGDTLLTIEQPELAIRSNFMEERIDLLNSFNDDLTHLIHTLTPSAFNRVTGLSEEVYQQEYERFKREIFKSNQVYLKTKQDWKRSKKLFDQDVIAAVEYENVTYEYDQAVANFKSIHQSFLSGWQEQIFKNEQELEKTKGELEQLKAQKQGFMVTAPVSGTVQELRGLYKQSRVFSNQELFKISPKGVLISECYITPADIGLIYKGSSVIFQIDAFDYNQWGTITGSVDDISDDVIIHEGRPYFRVKCKLEKEALTLNNGYSGKLKKGMTLNARFQVAQRSLWQLLYDKVDDWLNPYAVSG